MPYGGPDIKLGDSYGQHEIDGVQYAVLTNADGTVIKTNITGLAKWDETKYNLIEHEFPNLPFSICLDDDDLIKLDEPFTEEPVIFVKDDRASKTSYSWHLVDELERNQYNSNIKIEKRGDNSITLRQIILEMSNTEEYSKINEIGDDHRFLEGFDQPTPIQFVASFGS